MKSKLLKVIVVCVCLSVGTGEQMQAPDTTECSLNVWNMSLLYFQSRLKAFEPKFVHFVLEFKGISTYNVTSNVLRPLNWVWTYKSTHSAFPYLSWNIDYGLLSFGLLDYKTSDVPYVKLIAEGQCDLTIGTIDTSMLISKALTQLIQNITTESYHRYESSSFCYLAVNESERDTFSYMAALYLNYPVTYLGYICCTESFFYTNNSFVQICQEKQHSAWEQSVLGPYLLGLVLFMYCPIVLFKVCAWLVKDESEVLQTTAMRLNSVGSDDYEVIADSDGDWVYLDGNPPISVTDFTQFVLCNLGKKHPIIMSKIRRIICVLLTPSLIYLQLSMYSDGIGLTPSTSISVRELVKKGVPVGFLSLLGDKEDQVKVFAPYFGGPMCLLFMFYCLSILFIVVPRSLSNIVERGMPVNNMPSPLCLDTDDIIRLSMYRASQAPGYEKGHVVVLSSIYMLFSKLFWRKALTIQYRRIYGLFNIAGIVKIMLIIAFPIYVCLCILEIVMCIVFYGIPVFGFVTIIVKGAVKSLIHIRRMVTIFSNPLISFLGTCIALPSFLFYVYSVGLIFIQSFSFVCQIFIFCFIAVIMYPSVAFGYLFYCVVMLYYVVRLMKNFGSGYLELLSVAVEKSQDLYLHSENNVSFFNGELRLTNINVNGIRGIRVNDVTIDVAHNVLQRLHGISVDRRIKECNDSFGIPRSLFDYLVQKHKPVHIQVLKLFVHLSVIILLTAVTIEITSKVATGSSSDISEVMHVIFIVSVGALPHILEVALMDSKETVMREIESRSIEKSIKEYWGQRADAYRDFETSFMIVD